MDEEQRRTYERNAREQGFEAGIALTTEAYKEKFANPYQAAELGFIDEIILPKQTRKRLIQALEMTENKMQTNPPDGKFSEEEQWDLEEFVSGAAAAALPSHIKATLKKMRDTPPSLEEAIETAKKSGCSADDISDVMLLIINADSVVLPEEVQFMERWEALKPSYSTVQ